MIKKRKTQKMVFIDTSIFPWCNFDILNRLLVRLNKKKFILLLPEVIKSEIELELKESFISEKKYIKTHFDSLEKSTEETIEKNKKIKKEVAQEINKALEQAEDDLLKKKKEERNKKQDTFQKIFDHNNTEVLLLDDNAILLGISRSLRHIAPFSNKPVTDGSREKKENHHTKDVDCIAFELIKTYIKNNKIRGELIFCVDDSDYYQMDEEGKLTQSISKDIKDDLKKYSVEVKIYKDLIKLLEEEFSEKIPEKEKKEYKEEYDNRFLAYNPSGTPLTVFASSVSPSVGYLSNVSNRWAVNSLPLSADIFNRDFDKELKLGEPAVLASVRDCSMCGKRYVESINNDAWNFSRGRNLCEDCRRKMFIPERQN